MRFKFTAFAIIFAFCTGLQTDYQTQEIDLFQIEEISTIELFSTNTQIENDLNLAYRKGTKAYEKVYAIINGVFFDSIGVREKGTHSNSFAWINKKPLKLKLNEYGDFSYHGIKKFNLSNAFEDPSFQREMQSFALLKHLGLPVPKTGYVKFYLNGTYKGLYIAIEEIDKSFLKRNFGEKDGNLFEINGFCFSQASCSNKTCEAKTNKETANISDFAALLDLIENGSDANFEGEIEKHLNVSSLIKTLAVDNFLGNKDGFAFGSCHNFYLYKDSMGVFQWIPWDYNLSFGYNHNYSFWEMPNNYNKQVALLDRIFKLEKYQEMYVSTCQEIADYLSSRGFKLSVVKTQKLIKPSIYEQKYSFYENEQFKNALKKEYFGGLSTNIPGLLTYAKTRVKSWKSFEKALAN